MVDAMQSYGRYSSTLFMERRVRKANPRHPPHHLITNVLILLIQALTLSNNFIAIDAKTPIPHSFGSSHFTIDDDNPPWNPSPKIDSNGFLTESYSRVPGEWEHEINIGGKYSRNSRNTRSFEKIPVKVRQVPGDGNCLFHSITVALSLVEERRHFDLVGGGRRRNGAEMTLCERSAILRHEAINILDASPSSSGKAATRRQPRLLFIQGRDYITTDELLHHAASQWQLTGEEYCNEMRKDGYWGSGTEIVALCNVLRRPIHVYELTDVHPHNQREEIFENINGCDTSKTTTERVKRVGSGIILHIIRAHGGRWRQKIKNESLSKKPEFRLRRMACFGSPRFDNKEPLHILSADCRFPDLRPGRQASNGNHFLAMFPADSVRNALTMSPLTTRRGGFRVRRGGGNGEKGTIRNAKNQDVRRRRISYRLSERSEDIIKDTNGESHNQLQSFFAQLRKEVAQLRKKLSRIVPIGVM